MGPDVAALRKSIADRLPETFRFLEDLVRINSHTENAVGVNANASRIIEQFGALGFRATRVPCRDAGRGSHLIMDSGGSGPAIACISHLDTVFSVEEEARNCFSWRPEGNRIFGPGTYDIKGGTAMLWLLVTVLAQHDRALFARTRWILAWNAAEEHLVADFASLCMDILPSTTRACLVFEGDNESSDGFSLVHTRKGRGQFHIRVEGRGAHAGSRHQDGASAIRQLARVMEAVESFTDYSKGLTVNVGWMQGGTSPNRVPHTAEARLEVRFRKPEDFAWVYGEIRRFVGNGSVTAASDGFACQIFMELDDEIPSWPTDQSSERLAGIWRAAGACCELPVAFAGRGGLSDANRLWQHFPTLDGLGPRGGNPHASECSEDGTKVPEFIDASSFAPKTLINCLALLTLLGNDHPV